jgi:hypothetical protein
MQHYCSTHSRLVFHPSRTTIDALRGHTTPAVSISMTTVINCRLVAREDKLPVGCDLSVQTPTFVFFFDKIPVFDHNLFQEGGSPSKKERVG